MNYLAALIQGVPGLKWGINGLLCGAFGVWATPPYTPIGAMFYLFVILGVISITHYSFLLLTSD